MDDMSTEEDIDLFTLLNGMSGEFHNETEERQQANFVSSSIEEEEKCVKYKIKAWYGTEYEMTARELNKRIKEDSKSNYDWIASATELIRVCNEPGFPNEYAQNIKVAILNCFTSIIISDSKRRIKAVDEDAANLCYNSLNDMNNTIISAKLNYIKAIIKTIAQNAFEFPIYKCSEYNNFRSEWETKNFNELSPCDKINFQKFTETLKNNYCQEALEAGKRGDFKEGESEMMKVFYKMMKD